MDGGDVLQTVGALASVAGIVGGYYAWRALDDPTVRKSQERFREVRLELRESLARLSNIAADLHITRAPDLERIGPSALLADNTMRLPAPLPLTSIRLMWEEASSPKDDVIRAAAHKLLPLRTRWSKYSNYSQALEALFRPAMFENRQSFRLVRADWLDPSGPVLTFAPGYYFDLVDEGEALVHELALAVGSGERAPSLRHLPARARLMLDPLSLPRMGTIPSIGTLTIRRTSPGQATFFLIYRSIGQVATGEGTYNVIPGGIFQPASLSPLGHRQDLDLWRNIMREFNEEMLGAPEAKGDGGTEVDYTASPYRDFDRALASGHLQMWSFGMGIEAHNLVPCLLTAAVFDADTFDELFATMVPRTDEGVLVSSPHGGVVSGLPLERAVVDDLLQSPRLSPIPAALLHLALLHRDLLLDGTNKAAST